MSTVKNNTVHSRFAKIASLDETLFHIDDLANLWNIQKKNTLHKTVSRYLMKGLLYRIYRGFYSIKPITKVDPYLLGLKALHEYSYISTETVLVDAGIIMQKINEITLISSKSMHFTLGDNNYYSRQLSDRYLFQTDGIIEKNGIKIASVERAIADLLYFNKNTYFDNSNKINWRKVRSLQKKMGYPKT